MVPRIDKARGELAAHRLAREQAENRLVENQRLLYELKAQRSRFVGSRAVGPALKTLTTQISKLQGVRHDLLAEVARLDDQIGHVLGSVAGATDPEELFKALDGWAPVVLLPVRLETRFVQVPGSLKLCIRIFPDQIHLNSHIPELLPPEAELGRQYWLLCLDGDAQQIQVAWEELARRLSPTRAAWVVKQTKPTFAAPDDKTPVFPQPALRSPDAPRTPRATALPNQWIAMGFEQTGYEYRPIFQKWGTAVPDQLNVGIPRPAPTTESQAQAPEDELSFDPALHWTVDYAEAEQKGMAITVTQSDLTPGKSLADGVDLLCVLGIDYTVSSEGAAEKIADLLAAHQFTDGLAFVPHGTATNNTASGPSGFSPNPPGAEAAIPSFAEPAAVDPVHSASARLVGALGMRADAVECTLLPNAGLQEGRLTSLLIDVLWESTFGFYLDEMLDPLVEDKHIRLARAHAVQFLQPFGPLAPIRIGKQPYGLIPVVAAHSFVPDREQGLEAALHRILELLYWYWSEGSRTVVRMGQSDNPDDDLLKLLQTTALSTSKRYRRLVDPTAANLGTLEGYAEIHPEILASLFHPLFPSLDDSSSPYSKLVDMLVDRTHRPLYGPWVQNGVIVNRAPLEPNYITAIHQMVLSGGTGQQGLARSTRSSILLEAFLALAAQRELMRAASRCIDRHLLATGIYSALPSKSSFRVRTTRGILPQPESRVPGMSYVETAVQQANLIIPSLTGNMTVADYVSHQVLLPGSNEQPEWSDLSIYLANLAEVASYPAADIERAFRSILDSYSYRLDAWHTSLAYRRLKAVRASHPIGLHTGGYGWVESLRAEAAPQSLGYVHTPSLMHATTAAVLRSGNLSYRGAENADVAVPPGTEHSALNIDLSSQRVRLALSIIEGVSHGQQLAALLGYRFERGLRDRDIQLAQFIRPIRRLAPYNLTSPTTESGLQEGEATGEVVDGVSLLQQCREGADKLLDRIEDPAPSVAQKAEIQSELERLSDTLDAVSDVLVSEAVFQTVSGNYERASAALAALDRQSRPPEPQFIQTPRTGVTYHQRVLLTLQSIKMPREWDQFPQDYHAKAEPRLNAWVANIIGDPSRIRMAARVKTGDQVVDNLTASLEELNLSPLSLALSSTVTSAQRPSEFELRLADIFSAKVEDPDSETSLELLDEPPDASPSGDIGLGALLELLRMISSFVSGRRAADAREFGVPDADLQPGFMVEELQDRVDGATASLSLAIAMLNAATKEPQVESLRAALFEAAGFGVPDAIPAANARDPEALAQLLEQAERAAKTLALREAQLLEQAKRAAKAPALREVQLAGEDSGDPIGDLIRGLRIIFGESFPVLPLFSLPNVDALRATRDEQRSLLNGDVFAPLSWLQQIANVRPEVSLLSSLLTASEILGQALSPDIFNILQLPHSAGQAWIACKPPKTSDPPLLSIVAIGELDLGQPLAGLFCDGWSEVIPASSETTAITFHYDAPAARPPQCIILAVPPDLGDPTWSLEKLQDTVVSTFRLARFRAVGPQDIPVLGGGLLPAVFLPYDNSAQQPSVDLDLISTLNAAGVSSALGKAFTDGT